ncbi:MAG TPA: hypothetical protein VF278_18185 [Pirellulales bacterium]
MRIAVVLTLSLLLSGRARGVEKPAPIELTIHPRAIETPVLKYRLFPAEAELKPGNAVPILLRMPWGYTDWMSKVFPTLNEWESRPLSAPEWAASNGVLTERLWSEMKRAAFRREARWEYPIGEAPSVSSILLPDVAGLRRFLQYGLSARIRYHLTRGKLDAAREGILVGLANARHLAQTPFAVNQFVALAIHQAMLERTGELISQPNSPNLYWALSTLPQSLVELDRAASLQGDLFALDFPAVNELDAPREAGDWRRMAEQLVEFLEEDVELREQRTIPATRYIQKWVDFARAELKTGAGQKVAAKMSDEEVAVRWYVQQRLALDQRAAALVVLSPREAWPLLHRLRKDTASFCEKAGTKEVGHFNATQLCVHAWSLKRKIASLRVIEAVRDYLAANEGRPPAKLADIRGVPVPLDPMTGEAFHWQVDGKTATLRAPSLATAVVEPDWATALANTLEYRLEIK